MHPKHLQGLRSNCIGAHFGRRAERRCEGRARGSGPRRGRLPRVAGESWFPVLLALAALASLPALPARAEDADSQIRGLVRNLGYGAGIHNFKNYVLRGSEDYKTNALAKFKEAKDAIAALRADPAKKDMKKSLDDVEGTLKKYEDNVASVTKMIADKKSITEIDAAVKVDDAAAVAAFEVLRK